MEFINELKDVILRFSATNPYETLLLITLLINIKFIQGLRITACMMYLTAFKILMISFIGDVVPPSLESLFYIYLNLRLMLYLKINDIKNLLLITSLLLQIVYFVLAHTEYFLLGTIVVYELAVASDLLLYLNLIELLAVWYPLWKVLNEKLGIVLGPDSYQLRGSENIPGA